MAHYRIHLAIDDFQDPEKWYSVLMQLEIPKKDAELVDSIEIAAKVKEIYCVEDPDELEDSEED